MDQNQQQGPAQEVSYYCHHCRGHVDVNRNASNVPTQPLTCTTCHGDFIEEMTAPRPRWAAPGPFQQGAPLPPSHDFFAQMLGALRRVPPPGAHPQQPHPGNMAVDLGGLVQELLNAPGIRVHIASEPEGLYGNVGDYAWGPQGLEQILQQLMNIDGRVRREPPSPEVLARIPMTKVTKENVENSAQCTTCMEMFKEDEDVAVLGCRHIFHKPCILPWFERQSTCPVCRKEVKMEEWPDKSTNNSIPPPHAPHGIVDEDLD